MNIFQFGDGNFIRGFIDYMYQKSAAKNEITIYSIQSRATGKVSQQLKNQDCKFHVLEAGLVEGKELEKLYLIDTVKAAINPYEEWEVFKEIARTVPIDVIYSNTTEAGLVDLDETFQLQGSCIGYPAKLVQLLFMQYKAGFTNDIIVLPLELLHNNGDFLQEICIKIIQKWQLEEGFVTWFNENAQFYNTLVDRIVSGYPKELNMTVYNLSFEDSLLTQVEPYYLFAIEGPISLDEKLKLKNANEYIIYAKDLKQISKLKIELLNAVHTMLANIGVYKNFKTVREIINNKSITDFINVIVNEGIIQTSKDYAAIEGEKFYSDVINRFQNPFIQHYLTDIRLNNEFKVQTRLNPILKRIINHDQMVVKEYLSYIYILSYINDTELRSLNNVEYTGIMNLYRINFEDKEQYNLFAQIINKAILELKNENINL